MIEIRLCKIAMILSLALFALVCTADNLIDYGSNYEFVRHVLSMDTTFPGNALMGRAITTPVLWHAAYLGIIAAEGLTGLAFALSAAAMIGGLRGPAAAFDRAKRFAYLGTGLGFVLWFTGFEVVAGEWFAMWQSTSWNGQEAAFRFFVTLVLVILFVARAETELEM